MSEKENVEAKKEKKEFGKYDRWEIENAAETLIRAEQIKLDKDKMKYVLPILEKQKKALDQASSAAEILYGKRTTLPSKS